MESYKQQFIEFLVRSQVLTFGDFTTKSGRQTPYFVNTGKYRTGAQLAQLGRFYAQALMDRFGDFGSMGFDNLYGPAYKGIPLSVTTGIALHESYSADVSVTYNRKEAKDHGEKGILIGHPYRGDEKVVIIEDVITAGTSFRESLSILKHNGDPQVVAGIVSVDRAERGQGEKSAIQEVEEEFALSVFAIVTVRDIILRLHGREIDGQVVLDDARAEKMQAYLDQYGV